jgi:hypothetical protein
MSMFGVHTRNGKANDSNFDAKLDFARRLSNLLAQYTRMVESTDSGFFSYFDDPDEAVTGFAMWLLQKVRS